MRVKALLRRNKSDYLGEELVYQHLVASNFHLAPHIVLELRLNYNPKEFSLLELFMRHPNKVFTAEEIVNAVWKSGKKLRTGSSAAMPGST